MGGYAHVGSRAPDLSAESVAKSGVLRASVCVALGELSLCTPTILHAREPVEGLSNEYHQGRDRVTVESLVG